MKINKSFTKIIIGLLLICLLTFGVSGHLVSVSALAEVAPELAPVFDTQVYQLQDYIDHGGVTDPQLDIFYTLAGIYSLGQFGSENYTLTNPYGTKSGVLNWLKDVGIETYNTLITLAPDTVQLPDGSIMSTDPAKRALSLYVSDLMGCAIKATEYTNMSEFEDDIDNSDNFFIPWNSQTQYGLNTLYQLYGGVYNWQFDERAFTSNVVNYTRYSQASEVVKTEYDSYLNTLSFPQVRFYSTSSYVSDVVNSGPLLTTYTNLFIDLTNHTISLRDDSGHSTSNRVAVNGVSLRGDTIGNLFVGQPSYNFLLYTSSYNPNSYSTYRDIVQAVYDFNYKVLDYTAEYPYLEDFVEHVYVGTSWATRSEIFNIVDLNLNDDGDVYYVTPPDDTDYLFDIKGILQDILDNTDLYNVFINNIYTPDGVLVHDTDLIRINTSIYELLTQQNPPIPVDLNDLVEVTDNDYIDKLKEHAEDASNVLGLLVVSAHNIDYEFLYIILGTSLFTLICALLGKMGK